MLTKYVYIVDGHYRLDNLFISAIIGLDMTNYTTIESCLEAAETVDCHDLYDVLAAVNELGLECETASALLQNVLTIHATGDNCDDEDDHREVREIFL